MLLEIDKMYPSTKNVELVKPIKTSDRLLIKQENWQTTRL